MTDADCFYDSLLQCCMVFVSVDVCVRMSPANMAEPIKIQIRVGPMNHMPGDDVGCYYHYCRNMLAIFRPSGCTMASGVVGIVIVVVGITALR